MQLKEANQWKKNGPIFREDRFAVLSGDAQGLVKLLFRIAVGVAPNPIAYRQEDRELGTEILCQQFFCVLKEFFHFRSLDYLMSLDDPMP